jgi:hypothetical protein
MVFKIIEPSFSVKHSFICLPVENYGELNSDYYAVSLKSFPQMNRVPLNKPKN